MTYWSRAPVGFTEFLKGEGEREQCPPSPQRLVRTHPGWKRKGLYLSAHPPHVVGWPVTNRRLLLMDLNAHAHRNGSFTALTCVWALTGV